MLAGSDSVDLEIFDATNHLDSSRYLTSDSNPRLVRESCKTQPYSISNTNYKASLLWRSSWVVPYMILEKCLWKKKSRVRASLIFLMWWTERLRWRHYLASGSSRWSTIKLETSSVLRLVWSLKGSNRLLESILEKHLHRWPNRVLCVCYGP